MSAKEASFLEKFSSFLSRRDKTLDFQAKLFDNFQELFQFYLS